MSKDVNVKPKIRGRRDFIKITGKVELREADKRRLEMLEEVSRYDDVAMRKPFNV